jgi:tetratricopeptide (TPR) repeat protein
MNNLAAGYKSAGELDKALPLLERTLDGRKAKLGPGHPDTLRSMNNLASGYLDARKLDLALPLLEQSLVLSTDRLGRDHPLTLASLGNLAAVHWSMKRLDKSVPLFEELVPLYAAKLGRDHPKSLLAIANLGVNYKDAGRFEEAIPPLEEAHRAEKKVSGLGWVWQPLLSAYLGAGEVDKFADLLQEHRIEARKTLSRDRAQLADMLSIMGHSLLRRKKWADAEPPLRECLVIREMTRPDAWGTFDTRSQLGGALLGLRKHDEAEPLLIGGYEGMKQREATIPESGKVHLIEALDRLIELHTATDRPDEAAKWRAERAKYPKHAPPTGEAK